MSHGYVIPFEEKLKCSICQDRIKDARILSCGHTYCADCLEQSLRASHSSSYDLKCSECQKTTHLSGHGIRGLPTCFVINNLIDKINQTFGSGTGGRNNGRPISIGNRGFQAKDIFSCSICFDLMVDARYLPCGHCFCTACLTRQSSTSAGWGQITCCKCQRKHALPNGGIAGLPTSYRIKAIAAELKANDQDTTATLPSTSRGRSQPNGRAVPVGGPSHRSTTIMEDVEEAKKRAQARANQIQVFVKQLNGKTVTVDIYLHDTIAVLKRKIQGQIGIATSQQRLTCNGRNLDDNTKTLEGSGVVNHSTVHLNGRLRGGGYGSFTD